MEVAKSKLSTSKSLNYDLSGLGKRKLVLVHGYGLDSSSWSWLNKKLHKDFEIMSIQLPGFGGSKPLEENSIFDYAKYINSCIAKENYTEYLLCGHSMGSIFALYAAQINSGSGPHTILLINPLPLKVTVDCRIVDSGEERVGKLSRLKKIQYLINRTLKRKKYQYLRKVMNQTDPKTALWWNKATKTMDIAERIKGIAVPVHVIGSKSDSIVNTHCLEKTVLPFLNKPSLIMFSRAGHLIPIETPRKLARYIIKNCYP